jgi:oligoribonuclease (3'-5' exoribonuclease)
VTLLAFVDTETTGLDPDAHQIWEVGLILADSDTPGRVLGEYLWQLPVDFERADPVALEIGRFAERRWVPSRVEGSDVERPHPDILGNWPREQPRRIRNDQINAWAHQFALLTRQAHLVGAVVSFDEERLRRLLRSLGAQPSWHYHLVDVESLAAGRLHEPPPWKSDDLSARLEVEVSTEDRHTALGDAHWARRLYMAAMS